MSDYPRTSTVLKSFGIIHGSRWMEPKHARAGRYIHAGCLIMADGHKLDDDWFMRSSGDGQRDLVVHEECRPKLNGYAKFQRDHKPKLLMGEQELVHPVYRYVCHPDQVLEIETALILTELKAGMEQAWHELQMASYFLAVEYHYKRRPKAMALYLEPDDYRLEPLPDPYRSTSKFIALMSAYNVLREYKSNLLEG